MIGKMLAELGDPIGLALATYVADSEDFDTLKSSSARTLGSIARLRIPCPEQANQAVEVMERLASNNIKPYSLAVILWETERPGFPPEAAARIQQILEQSGRLPPFVSTPRMRERILKRKTPTDIPQEGVFSRPAPGAQRPRGVRLDPPELEMPISHSVAFGHNQMN